MRPVSHRPGHVPGLWLRAVTESFTPPSAPASCSFSFGRWASRSRERRSSVSRKVRSAEAEEALVRKEVEEGREG